MPENLNDVNFVPEEILEAREQVQRKSTLSKVAIFVAILSILAAAGVFGYDLYLKNKLNSLQSEKAEKNATIESLKGFGETGYKLGVRLAAAEELLNTKIYFSKVFEEIRAQTPENVEIRSWQVNSEGVLTMVAFSTPNYVPIAEFQNNLLNSETNYFDTVRLQSAALDGRQQGVNFSFEIQLDLESVYERLD